MRPSPFAWLGSGRTRKHDVGQKGKMLDLAARGGLPVPQGGILLDEFFRICLAEGVIDLVGSHVVVPDPVWLHEVLVEDVRFPQLKSLAAVRLASAAKAPGTGSHVQLNVNFDDSEEIAHALRQVWSFRDPRVGENKMDVLVMAMVDTKTWGLAVSNDKDEQDSSTFLGGQRDEKNLVLPRPRLFRRSNVDLLPFARRLQKLLGGVRRTFGRGDYQVEWADDGEICWIIQIFPNSDF